LAKEIGGSAATMTRLSHQRQYVGLDLLYRLPKPFGLRGWQLLAPEGQPEDPRAKLSTEALDLASRLDGIADAARRSQACALAMHAVHALAAVPLTTQITFPATPQATHGGTADVRPPSG